MHALGINLGLEGGVTIARLKKDLKLRVYKEDTRETIDAATIPALRLHVQSASIELEEVYHENVRHNLPRRVNWVNHAELAKTN